MHKQEGDSFLDIIIITDETWRWMFDPESIRGSGKHMFIMFAIQRDIVLTHAIPARTCTTVNSEYYSPKFLLLQQQKASLHCSLL